MIAMHTTLRSTQVNTADLLFQYEFHAELGIFPGFTEQDFIKVHDQYLSLDYRKDALKAIEAGLKSYPKSSGLYAYKAIRLMESRKTKIALEYLAEAEFRGHCVVDSGIIRAQIFSKQNKNPQALTILKGIKEHRQLDTEQLCQVTLTEVDLLVKEQMNGAAFELLSNLLFKNPNQQCLLVAMKSLIADQRWHRESVDFHSELTAKDPYAWGAWYNLGHAYYGCFEYEKAIEAFEYCFLINPNFAPAYLDCAEVCQEVLKFQKALICYDNVLKFVRPDEKMTFQIAECYFGLDNIESAKKYYLKAVQLDPNRDELFFQIGKCYEKEFSLKMAERFYLKAFEMDNSREDYLEALASCYFKMGRHSKVTPLLEKVIVLNPSEDHAWVMYAKYLILTGQFDIAKMLFIRAEEHTYSGKLLLCKAAMLYLTGKEKDAFDAFGEGLEESYESLGLFFELVPHVRHDEKIKAALNYYDPEYLI